MSRCLLAFVLLLTLKSIAICSDSVRWELTDPSLKSVGAVRVGDGPRSPEFPAFPPENRSMRFDGAGSRIVIPDSEELRFTGGDTITVEAWIAPRRVKGTSPIYIVGKGRTGTKGFRRDNQNWALRLTPKGEGYRLSFLFATAKSDSAVSWHRWTSDAAVVSEDGWHHVAATYEFGRPESIQGWLDGVPCEGKWDMQGPTKEDPIVDKDDVWIGSASGGSRGNSFFGSIDSVTVHRRRLSDQEISERFLRDESIPRVRRIAKPVVPTIETVPVGQVILMLHENLPVQDQWPDQEDWQVIQEPDSKQGIWTSNSFLIPRLPTRYDGWGIRSAWKAPGLLRIAADVALPVGKQRFMIRARSLSRLWIDNDLVGQTQLRNEKAPSGEEPITPLATPPHPGVRVKGYRQQEIFLEYEVKADGSGESHRRSRVVFELIIGGKGRRTETGEICVAIESANGDSYDVLTPISLSQQSLSLQEQEASDAIRESERAIRQHEDHVRKELASTQDEFWDRRRVFADQWLQEHPKPSVPEIGILNPVDAFLSSRLEHYKKSRAVEESPQADGEPFRDKVWPLLQTRCLRCHGKATKGGLRLDSKEAAISGGESGWAAIVPGDPEESELVLRIQSDDPDTRMPPEGDPLPDSDQAALIEWIKSGAFWPQPTVPDRLLQVTSPIEDSAFIRRAALDAIGVPPSQQQVVQFINDDSEDKRERLVEQLLSDDRVADHLMADWLDMLAENPTLLNTSLNSTGPFRWFLYESFRDRKPIDRMVTELILMRGDAATGGSAGFGVAGENDSPMAAKAHIIASGLMGIELQCARCHDSPYHSSTQEDLFSVAAMLNRKPLTVPSTSRVPDAFFQDQSREPLIEVSLGPQATIDPEWTLDRFTGIADDSQIDALVQDGSDSRQRLAALVTSPANNRFAAVIVNRVWRRLMGAGLVASVNDWEHLRPSHPDLLQWLSHDFIESGYDIRHLMRRIMTSEVYGRVAVEAPSPEYDGLVFFAAPFSRRLTAEQVVDSLFAVTGQVIQCEPLTFVHDGRRPLSNRQSLGKPRRAWMMATLNNERDRPSLSLPGARAIEDVMVAFGWSGSRQKPIHEREADPNVLQPGILANGVLATSLSRASHRSELAERAVQSDSVTDLVESLFLSVLSRRPSDAESRYFERQLLPGFSDRVIPETERSVPVDHETLPLVHWFNHLRPRANQIQQELERRVRQGPSADPRLRDDWRQRYEDVVWSLINHDEFVWMP